MFNLFESLGFTSQDIAMLSLSILCGIFGAVARAFMLESKLSEYDADTKSFLESFNYRDFQWLMGHIVVGSVTGLLVALLFIGAINEDRGAFARVLAIALLMGYSAPTFWSTQEKTIGKIVEKRLKKLGNDSSA